MIVVFTSAESISYYLASMCVTMLILYYIQNARLKAMIHVCIVKYLYQNHGILENYYYIEKCSSSH